MANIDSATLKANNYMQAFGEGNVASGNIALSAAPNAADVIRLMRIPAGNEISALLIANDQLDTNGSKTLVASIGYMGANTADNVTAQPAAFAAAGQTTFQAVNQGTVFMKFAPITFAFDVYLTITVGTAAATFNNGSIYAAALGRARGVK